MTMENITSCETNQCLYLPFETQKEIIEIINSLKNTSSIGMDNIPAKIIKLLCLKSVKYITQLVNLTIKKAQVPDTLKIAINRPIYKAGIK